MDAIYEQRQIANMLLTHEQRSLRKVQEQILLFERFGEQAMLNPEIQRGFPKDWGKALQQEHDRTAARIAALAEALEKDDMRRVASFARDAKRRHGL